MDMSGGVVGEAVAAVAELDVPLPATVAVPAVSGLSGVEDLDDLLAELLASEPGPVLPAAKREADDAEDAASLAEAEAEEDEDSRYDSDFSASASTSSASASDSAATSSSASTSTRGKRTRAQAQGQGQGQAHAAAPKEDNNAKRKRATSSTQPLPPRTERRVEADKLAEEANKKLRNPTGLSKEELKQLRKEARMARNRASAERTRMRRLEYVTGLEDRVKELEAQNRALLKLLQNLDTTAAASPKQDQATARDRLGPVRVPFICGARHMARQKLPGRSEFVAFWACAGVVGGRRRCAVIRNERFSVSSTRLSHSKVTKRPPPRPPPPRTSTPASAS